MLVRSLRNRTYIRDSELEVSTLSLLRFSQDAFESVNEFLYLTRLGDCIALSLY